MKIDCNKQCKHCPVTICEERGNYIDAGTTSKINEKYIRNETTNVTVSKFLLGNEKQD